MQVVTFQTRPIDQWPRAFTKNRKRATFSIDYGAMNADLYRELELLGSKAVVLLMAIDEHDIRLDGRPRAGAKLKHPGVIVSAETKHGPMRWACDTYTEFADNLRAITLTLKNLRLIDGYGCTSKGEQYRGWAALPAPDSRPFSDRATAIAYLAKYVGGGSPSDTAELVKAAVMKSHPDKGGNAEAFKAVMDARKFIEG